MKNPKITFYGGVGSATGANIALEFGHTKILVDCGILQGLPEAEERNFRNFGYNPAEFRFLCITHAHMDHIGKIPKLVKEGFKGEIISTEETKEMAGPMLLDALKVMKSKHPGKVLYGEEDIGKTLSLWKGRKYGEKTDLGDMELVMTNAGHILGSAILNIRCGDKVVSLTGDLGNSPSPLLPDAEFLHHSDYLVMESVYGDRNHEDKETRTQKLKQIIENGVKKGGTIVIPAFSIERTQVILFELNNLIESGELPSVPVFLDSPLADKITGIYKKYSDRFKDSVRKQMEKDDIFDFPKLSITKNTNDSLEIKKIPGPKIILAGSGMSEGGRVLSHEALYLPGAENTVILVGYQPIGTLGRLLESGVDEVEIGGNRVEVRARVENIKGYSSHMDSDHLLEFVERSSEAHKLKKVFCIMGEPKSSLFLVQRIKDYLGVDATYPEEGREYQL